MDWSTTDTSQAHTTFLSYNLFDKLQWKRDADGREEFHDYDGTGRLIATHVYPDPSLPSGVSLAWENLYDWNDSARILTETDPLGTKTLFHWDGLGRDTLIERDSGRYESVGSGTASAGAHASSTSSRIQVHQVYDNLGNLVRLTDPKGLVETRRYDDRNRLVETVYPDDLRHAVGYDLASRAVADTQSSSQGLVTKKLWYDGLDRLVSEDYGSGARENASYVWDGSASDKGRLSQVVRGTGVTASYGYDAVGRRTSRAVTYQGLSLGQGWSYDLAGSPVQWTLPGGAHGSAGYDVFHRLSGSALVRGTDSVSVLGSVTYRRNDLLSSYGLGKRLSVREGYESQRSVLTEHQVVRLLSNGASVQDTLYRERLGWDGAGNVIGMLRGNGDSLLFGLDHLYQLREVDYPDGQSLVTDYDANGNRVRHRHPMGEGTSDSFAYSGNRVTTGQTARKGVTTYRHDIQGNLSVESDYSTVSDTGDASKAWRVTERRFNRRNELERVVQIRRLGTTDTTLLGFVYGEDGNRIASLQGSVSGSDTTWTATHRWVYDGSVISADSGDGHGWRWHAYQGLSRIAEGEDTGSLRVRYVVTDHQGTTQLLTDDTGAVLGRWTWDPWGNIEEAWSQSSTDLLYQGKPYEVALGEWYFNARWYNPERGMFTGRDPKLQFYSPYGYVGGQPNKLVDDDGMDAAVTWNSTTHQVVISLNIIIFGTGASEASASAIKQNILQNWDGQHFQDMKGNKWTVNVDLNVSSSGVVPPNAADKFGIDNLNVIDIREGASRSYVTGGNAGIWRGPSTWQESGNPAAHEFGHLIGLKDRYTEDSYHTITVLPKQSGNIMAEEAGKGVVDARNFAELFNSSTLGAKIEFSHE